MRKILNDINEALAVQKTYDGKKRSDLKDSDFLFPETKSFPIVSPTDVKDAISNYGRMSGKMTYDAFLRKLYNMCKRKGPSFVAALPQASKEKLGIKTESTDITTDTEDDSMLEDDAEYLNMACNALRNINSNIAAILNNINLDHVKENLTEPWVLGIIAVIEDNISSVHDFVKFNDPEDDSEEAEAARKKINHHKHQHKTKPTTNIPYRVIPGFLMRVGPSHNEQNEHESHEEPSENNEPTNDTDDAPSESPAGPAVNAGLSLVCDNCGSINEVGDETIMDEGYFTCASCGKMSTLASKSRPGLWENIRKKKEREGKDYKPAKRGDKDRPDSDQWKKLTEDNKKK